MTAPSPTAAAEQRLGFRRLWLFLRGLAWMNSGYGYIRLSVAMLFDPRLAVLRRLHRLSPRFYDRARLGDLVSRLNGDVAEAQRISADTFLSTGSDFLFAGGSVCVMLWLQDRALAIENGRVAEGGVPA